MYGITYIDRVNVSTAASAFQKELHLIEHPGRLGFFRLRVSLPDLSDYRRLGERPLRRAPGAHRLGDHLGGRDGVDGPS